MTHLLEEKKSYCTLCHGWPCSWDCCGMHFPNFDLAGPHNEFKVFFIWSRSWIFMPQCHKISLVCSIAVLSHRLYWTLKPCFYCFKITFFNCTWKCMPVLYVCHKIIAISVLNLIGFLRGGRAFIKFCLVIFFISFHPYKNR